MSGFNRNLSSSEMALYWKVCLGGVYFAIALFGGGAIYFLFIAAWMAARIPASAASSGELTEA